ncbi:hypothetical protein WN48_05458 [Eufriesea mexicana]|nr:hypothetical protein WN48_05458 [Eufriesea mexicana]
MKNSRQTKLVIKYLWPLKVLNASCLKIPLCKLCCYLYICGFGFNSVNASVWGRVMAQM